MAEAYLPPVRVSPLIRFGRWAFLGTGILYGLYHHSRLSKKETIWREQEAKQKVIRDVKKAAEKFTSTKAEMVYLSKETGMELPAEFRD